MSEKENSNDTVLSSSSLTSNEFDILSKYGLLCALLILVILISGLIVVYAIDNTREGFEEQNSEDDSNFYEGMIFDFLYILIAYCIVSAILTVLFGGIAFTTRDILNLEKKDT